MFQEQTQHIDGFMNRIHFSEGQLAERCPVVEHAADYEQHSHRGEQAVTEYEMRLASDPDRIFGPARPLGM